MGEHRIELRRDTAAQCWTATTTGGDAERIRALFGTTTLPTAYGLAVPAAVVRADIQALNPDAIILAPAGA